MAEYLPEVYVAYREKFSDVMSAYGEVAAAVRRSGPLDARTLRLVKLGVAVGAPRALSAPACARPWPRELLPRRSSRWCCWP
jgi:hypothetical protein